MKQMDINDMKKIESDDSVESERNMSFYHIPI